MKNEKLSEFYQSKPISQQRADVIKEIVACEGLLSVEAISLTSHKGVLGVNSLRSITMSIQIFPNANNKLYKKILPLIREYMEELKVIKAELFMEEYKEELKILEVKPTLDNIPGE